MAPRRHLGALILAVLLGCSPSATRDGGPGEGGSGGITPPNIPWLQAGEPQRIPWLDDGLPPIAWPCPPGWREETDDGLTVCLPYPEDRPADCSPGAARFPGEVGCRPLGRACREGPFADASDLDSEHLLHVDASAGAGGDGNVGSPFVTLAEAFDAATEGTTVLLAAGRYVVDRLWPSGVSVRGRCAARTSLAAPVDVGERTAVVESPAGRAGFRLEDVTIGPAPIRGVELRGAGAAIGLEALRIAGTTAHGLLVQEGPEVSARDLVIEDTASLPDGTRGRGIVVWEGGRITLERGLVRRTREVGVLVVGESSLARFTDVVVRETRSLEDGSGGAGLSIQEGAVFHLERGLVQANRDLGVGVREASATLTDVVVLDTEALDGDPWGGWGIYAYRGASLVLQRGLVKSNRTLGVAIFGAGTTATIADLAVLDTAARESDASGGRGISAQLGSTVTLERAVVRRNQEIAVFVHGEGTSTTLSDVAILDTEARPSDGFGGRGLEVSAGAALTLERGLLRGNRDIGIFVASAGTSATLTDVAVLDTRAQERSGAGGSGIGILRGAELTLERGLVLGNRAFGIRVADIGTSASLTDVAVVETRARDSDDARGTNVGAYLESEVRLERFVLAEAGLCGVQIAGGSLVRLTDGYVRGQPIAICLQTPDYPRELLRDNVIYVDNGMVGDSTMLEVPQPDSLLPVTP
ncbi:MAG: hypothetical protein ACFCGT_10750 [Sandaracinaceae bacterium]